MKKLGQLTATDDLQAAVKNSWLVFEAVPEKLKIKEDTFLDLERYGPDDCILATNSSSFKSGELITHLKQATHARVLNTREPFD